MAVLFENAWERRSQISPIDCGCTPVDPGNISLKLVDKLTSDDPGGWSYDGPPPPGPCGDPWHAETVISGQYSGDRCVRQNLPAYTVINKNFGSHDEVYIRYHIKYGDGFGWGTQDSKSTFLYPVGDHHLYLSTFKGADPFHGLIKFFWPSTNEAWLGTNADFTTEVWHYQEWHFIYGASAAESLMEARFDGTVVVWGEGDKGSDGGDHLHPNQTEYDLMGNWYLFSLDGWQNGELYHDGGMYFDEVKITDGVSPDNGWIGPAEAGEQNVLNVGLKKVRIGDF